MLYNNSIFKSPEGQKLHTLIEERVKSEDNTSEIDEKIWEAFGEEWVVMFTDLSGFSRGVEKFGIIHFLETIYQSELIFAPIIEEERGKILKFEGDSLLVIFADPKDAIEAAIKMNGATTLFNKRKELENEIHVCIGLGYGKVLKLGDVDVFGREVNAASKLGEDVAKAGEILVTEDMRRACDGLFSFTESEKSHGSTAKIYALEY